MSNYDFKNLNPNEFETLSNDLLSRLFETHIERFKPGKDLGIDGRFFSLTEGEVIIQSKHYATSGFKSLLADLTKNELPKIKKISPNKYILSTSVPLSPQEKKSIQQAIKPFIVDSSDVFGKDDLNALLMNFADIEKNHFKLWIASSNILMHFLNAAIHNASKHVISEAYEKNKNYVLTESHKLAKERLGQSNVLVITGDPGVGKTTLAEQLCLEFVADGFDFYSISNDIEEGFSVLNPEGKQIFYFDDFLGKNFIETLRFNEDARIMHFISRVTKSNNKRFILTSRTNILDQGYRIGPSFIHEKIKTREYILDVSGYSYEDKAKILYSFLWRSDLSKEFLGKIIGEKKYTKIIYHRNYNPRLLEFITSNDHVEVQDPSLYLEYIDKSLANPQDVWRQPYTTQIDDASRAVVDLIVFGNGAVEEHALRSAYDNFISSGKSVNKTHISRDFDSTMAILSRSFIKRAIIQSPVREGENIVFKDMVTYTPFNPSISDFILGTYVHKHRHIAEMVMFYEGLEGVLFLEKIKTSNPSLVNEVARIIFDKLKDDILAKGIFYLIKLGNMLDSNSFPSYFSSFNLPRMQSYIVEVAFVNESMLEFCSKVIAMGNHTDEELAALYLIILDYDMPYSELEYFSSMLEPKVPSSAHDDLVEKYYIKLLHAWKHEMLEGFAKDRVEKFSSVSTWHDEDGNPDYYYNIDEDALATLISDHTSELFTPIEFNDAKAMLTEIDLENIVADYYKDEQNDDFLRGGGTSMGDDIHNIFEGLIEAKFS